MHRYTAEMPGVASPLTEEMLAVSEDDSLAALIRNLTPHMAKELWEIRICLKPELAGM